MKREPETSELKPANRLRNFRHLWTGVRGIMVAVACCGILLWAARKLWETQHPVIAACRGLKAPSVSERLDATRLILQVGIRESEIVIPALIGALDDPEADVRAAAVTALRSIIDEALRSGSANEKVRAAVGAVIGSLRDSQPTVRIAAVAALYALAVSGHSAGKIDFREVSAALATMLGDRDQEVRLAAVRALAVVGPFVQQSPTLEILAALNDQSVAVRAAAVRALASFPCSLDRWLPFLFRGLVSEEPQVRAACAGVVSRREHPPVFSRAAVPDLIAYLQSPERIVRAHAVEALDPHARDPLVFAAIPRLLVLLSEPVYADQAERKPDELRSDPAEEAAILLGEIAPGTASAGEVVAALSAVVQSGHPERSKRAARALGNFGAVAEPAIPVLINALRSARTNEGLFPYSVTEALGRIAPDTQSAAKVVAALSDVALHSPSLHHRAYAIRVLARFGDDAATAHPMLHAMRKDPNFEVRSAAAASLATLEAAW
jgi:HEAT repeat protein